MRVSDIGYGLWGMGGWTGSDDAQSRRSLQMALDAGVNFFDSAWAYGEGRSDSLLGELVRNNPEKTVYTASKIPPKNGKWPARPDDRLDEVFPPKHIIEYAQRIREAMGVSTIDLLQLHVWDDSWASDPSWVEAVEELKARAVIRFFGISLNRWEPENGIRAVRGGHVDTVQVIYNIFDQAPEDELFPACREMNVGIVARVPLDEGSLTGNLTLDTRFPEDDWRSRYFGPENLAPTVERVEQLKHDLPAGASLPEIALRFILSNPDVSTTIVGMRKPDHVVANIAASDAGPLEEAMIARLRPHRWDREPAPWSA
jgi:aryl-alcohol dehydrogenase-like predicted oxidoreductase